MLAGGRVGARDSLHAKIFSKERRPNTACFHLPSTGKRTGNTKGELVIQALTRENELIAENRLPLQFVEPNSDLALADFGSQLPAYLAAFTDSLTLFQHIRDHHPKADASQRKTIDGFLETATVEQMQAFLAYFWEEQAPDDPEAGWRTYTTAIAYADSAYGACRQGHGAETDMATSTCGTDLRIPL